MAEFTADNQASGNVDAKAADGSRRENGTWPGDVLRFFTPARLIKICILGALWIGLFHGTMWRLVRVWMDPNSADWSHGPLIPVFSIGILLYIHDRWTGRKPTGSYLGLVVVFGALLANVVAVWWFQIIMLEDYSWWLMLIGLVITMCGWRFAAVVWFPMLFIVFGIRISGQLYTKLQTAMQLVAAQASAALLNLMHITANLDGVVINMYTRTQREVPLTVAEACSGMRILMAFAALGSLLAYTVRRPWWHRLTLVIAILPIAVVANVLRITAMGLLHYIDRDSWAEGLAHTLEGLFMLPIAFGLFWLLHKLLCCLIIEEKPAEGDSSAGTGKAATANPPGGLVSMAISAGRAAVAGLGGFGRYIAWAVRSPGEFWKSVGPDLRERHFLALAGVMLVAVVSWNWVSQAMGLVFSKSPVPLKKMLDQFAREIPSVGGGHWVAKSNIPGQEDPKKLSEVIRDVAEERFLGATHPYRLRNGRNWDPAHPDDPALLKESQYIQRTYRYVGKDGQEYPGSDAYFFISYYTGTPDPVPHVPERCYAGGGWTELPNKIERKVYIPTLARSVPIRVVQFANKEDQKTTVAYLLYFNGQVSSDHKDVRLCLSNPFSKYAYFSKIEMKFFGHADDVEGTLKAATSLLADFLPILERDYLPDWSHYAK